MPEMTKTKYIFLIINHVTPSNKEDSPLILDEIVTSPSEKSHLNVLLLINICSQSVMFGLMEMILFVLEHYFHHVDF